MKKNLEDIYNYGFCFVDGSYQDINRILTKGE